MSTQGYHDMSVHNPYPFHESGRKGGQGGRGYYRPHEEVPRHEGWHEDNLFEDFGQDPNVGKAYNSGYYSNQQGDKALDKIKWKVPSFKGEKDDCHDNIVDKEECDEDQEMDSFEAFKEVMSLMTIRAFSTQVFEEEKMREKERLESEKKKKSIEEGKRIDERKVSVEKPREEKLKGDKKMSDQKSTIEAIEKEEMVLLLYCKGTFNIEEYKDVFPKEMPGGLPRLRGIEHRISLVLGVVLPNRLAYRSFPKETKELRRQVEDLLSKGSQIFSKIDLKSGYIKLE
ncbi:hypothetical protein M9H77_07825 [Catharanthus roseus]|uniref:Uncharacterized protein n=1 Tax=Catharanthus roseus TaxID=4058 RepID=A0ACC0BW78_CATRO|nr:hypothetical protein M9H77_07825 [Catharanthus roseus]